MMVAVSGKYFRAGRIVVPAMLVALCAVALWADSAQARFTCSTNQDCAAKANQCDPGRTPCNDGICNPNAPGADSIGCILIPNDDKCDDGSFCNGTQVCDPNHGCKDPVIPDCDDDIPCTNDFCNEEANECSNVPRNERCSDGQYCDGVEICDPEDGCKAGPPPNCNDNTVCTTDTCDEATDSCKHTQNNGSCSNGLYCDGVETCSPTGCKPGTPPNCADSTSCTIDTCDEATDSCKRTPNNASCSNGQFCDGVEVCSPTLGCRPGTPPNCNDNIVCTTDACVEATDSCSHVVNNANCNNGKFCDGVEVCSPTLGCRPGTPPNCNDNFPCTQDVCVEANDTWGRSLGVKLGGQLQNIGSGGLVGDPRRVVVGPNVTRPPVNGSGNNTFGDFVNLPAIGQGGFDPASIALSLFNRDASRFINLEISALEADGKGKVVSSPRIITADQKNAFISQGTKIPFQKSTSSGATAVEFVEATLKLDVTPQITPEGNVILTVKINKDSLGTLTALGREINVKEVRTEVLVENGGTVVIGGIFEQNESSNETKVPLLGDIPYLGNLFKTRTRDTSRTELLVFLTPRVVTERSVVR